MDCKSNCSTARDYKSRATGGDYYSPDANHFEGLLDNLRIFHSSLTDAEVSLIYAAELGGFGIGGTMLSDVKSSVNVYPNPLVSSTTISFSLTGNSKISIDIYDLSGKWIQTVADENVSSGNHKMTLQRGRLISGIYLLKMQLNYEVVVKKLIVE